MCLLELVLMVFLLFLLLILLLKSLLKLELMHLLLLLIILRRQVHQLSGIVGTHNGLSRGSNTITRRERIDRWW